VLYGCHSSSEMIQLYCTIFLVCLLNLDSIFGSKFVTISSLSYNTVQHSSNIFSSNFFVFCFIFR